MTPVLRSLWSPWWTTATEILGGLEAIARERQRSLPTLLAFSVVTLGGWFVYVPLHELLHAYGCMAAGGQVQELRIQGLYGGHLLERLFPFVRAGGEYAGRLTGFDTRGSDLVYLATDVAPFLLTLLAVPLLSAARARHSAVLLGLGTVLAGAVLVSVPGDLYEMGSILVSSALRILRVGGADGQLLALRHDDVLALLAEFRDRFPDHRAGWAAAVAVSAVVGWVLGGAILAASRMLATLAGRLRAR